MTSNKRRNLLPLIIGLAVVVLLILCFVGVVMSASSSSSPSPDSPGEVVGTGAGRAADSAAPLLKSKAPAPNSQTVGQGDWMVGDDIKPGKYRTSGAEEGLFELCIWTVKASDAQDANVVTFGSSNAKEPGRVTLKAGQLFSTSGCELWALQK